MIEKRNFLSILKNAKRALKERNVLLLKEMSNRTIHSASLYQDPDAVVIAVTIYTLSKLLERENYRSYPEWKPFVNTCLKFLEKAIECLEKDKLEGFRKSMISIREAIEGIGSRLKTYILEVFRKAAINKASRIYEHGISRAETSRLLGITQWELAEYVGATWIADVDLSITMPIEKRIKVAEKLFK
ncbi:MAG: hypothetical protein QXP53_01065 [Candidatus Pacearchaeota archaeon]